MKKIQVCDVCLNEDFLLQGKIAVCKNCKAKYQYNSKKNVWELIRDLPDQKQFINETSS